MAGCIPRSTGHLCFVLLRGNINDGDFNWIWVWFVVTLRGSGCEATACASSFRPFKREELLQSWSWLSAPLPLRGLVSCLCCPPRGWSPAVAAELWSVRRKGGDPPYRAWSVPLNVFRGSLRWHQTAAALQILCFKIISYNINYLNMFRVPAPFPDTLPPAKTKGVKDSFLRYY